MSDEQICSAFDTTAEELSIARNLLKQGYFRVDDRVNFSDYLGEIGEVLSLSHPNIIKRTINIPRSKKTPLKKQSKILTAFYAIPDTPVDAIAFANEHGISVEIFRQRKRFDKTGLGGVVKLKKTRGKNEYLIWRDYSETES